MENERQKFVIRTAKKDLMLDEIDIRILSTLQQDGRISKTHLGEIVNLSPSACLDRMRRLEKKKLILSYHAQVDIRAIVGMNTFFTEIVLGSHRATDFGLFESHVQRIDEIIECVALGGGIDYILKVVCRDIDRYQELIDRMLEAKIGIDRYFTYIVTKPVKFRPQPLVSSIVGN